ncbi:MAG: hypothetical protein HYU70_02585 [Bacteroidetes bacterium]|nr:hypothetical protein [Bacteroidota bacterium]
MTYRLKKMAAIGIILMIIGISLPLFIKSILLKRVLQITLLCAMSILLVRVVEEKKKTNQKINYINLIIVTLYGLALYFVLKNK